MKCPFCQSRLLSNYTSRYSYYSCRNSNCINDGMPRCIITYNNYPTYLVSRTIMLDKYYVVINYVNNTTTVSVLMGCILFDSVVINKAMTINLNDITAASNKIKALMVFS